MHISYQLYCSRNFPPLSKTCAMLSAAGYTEVEGYGGLFGDVDALEHALKDAGLHMTSAHMGLDMVAANPSQAIEIAKRLDIGKVYVPHIKEPERPTDDAGWRAFGQKLAAAGQPLKDAGLVFGWHNHDFELKPTSSGAMPLDLIAEADLSLELDLGWVLRAGQDPVAWIDKYAGRISAVHVKDIAPAGEAVDEDGWADVGHGIQDWAAIHAALDKAGIDHLVIEHDNPKDDARLARRSIATLNAL